MFFMNLIMEEIDWMKQGQEPLAHAHEAFTSAAF
jgi:hypothetical protein